MRNLQQYIEENINSWRSVVGKPLMSLPLSQEEINDIAEDLDCRMSPENLHCDGEISATEAGRKAGYYCQVFAELKTHAKSQGLAITVQTWDIS